MPTATTATLALEKGKYAGDVRKNKPHGHGKMVYNNGAVYEGMWHKGKRHGSGVHTNSRGTYEGEWAQGKKCGLGVLATGPTEEDVYYQGRWDNEDCVSEDEGVPDAVAAAKEAAASAAAVAAAASPAAAAAASPVAAASDSVDCSPPGVGGTKRKRRSGGEKKAAKAAKEAAGGYYDKYRGDFRAEGGVLATGGKRTCLPDALYNLLPHLSVSVDLEMLRTMMPADPHANTLFSQADAYLGQFGLTLPRVTKGFMVAGGVELALLKAPGYYVAQLAVTFDNCDKKPDLHCVACDGETVRDNSRHAKVKVLDASDRSSPDNARDVFRSLFPGLKVVVKNVYELKRKPGEENEDPQAP